VTEPGTPNDARADAAPATAARARFSLARLVRAHPTAWLASALGLVFLLLGTGAVFAGAAVGRDDAAATPAPTTAPTGQPAAEDGPRSVPATLPGAARLRTCTVADAASDPRLMSLKGHVMNAATGEVLFSREGDVPNRTGSVLKVLTASAAIAVLGPDYRLSTRVVEGATPSSIVLVGGGDPTLSASSSGSVYAGAPKIADLAAKAKAAHDAKYPGTPITEVVLDASYWNPAGKWDPIWKRTEQTIGYHSEVTALMVDGDRADPAAVTSPRSTDPVGRAGSAFAAALGGSPKVSLGTASSSTVLAEVQSQPVSALIEFMLLTSDNTLAENLARVVSVRSSMGGSAASLQQAIPAALETFDLNADALVIKDGSGLSEANGVPPAFVAQLMVKVMNGEGNLSAVYNALPVAGETGSLASRFTGANAVATGSVIAKTGWIDTAYTLGGVVHAADGTALTFAFYAIGDGITDGARAALDTLATGVFNCGDNLSNT
jgi:D-alanyl-D-alanine carboxypeptidase/D-alanyl-D-alanine-endopeptidase (penicillin-binding protein 4)